MKISPRLARNLAVLSIAILAARPTSKKQPQINWRIINSRGIEGNKLKGYVPQHSSNGKVIGHSGVTVAGGVDIGQYSKRQINQWEIPESTKEKLRPCAGKKKQAAVDCLKEHPIILTPTEDKQVNEAIEKVETAKTVKWYDSDGKDRFVDLPPPAQTAVASLFYQNGEKIGKRFGNVVKFVHHRQFLQAATALLGKHDGFRGRHTQEAKLLTAAAHYKKPSPAGVEVAANKIIKASTASHP